MQFFKEAFKRNQHNLDEGKKLYFKLFEETTFDGKLGRGARYEEHCLTSDQAPEVSAISQFPLSCSLQLADAFVAKQSTSSDPSVLRFR